MERQAVRAEHVEALEDRAELLLGGQADEERGVVPRREAAGELAIALERRHGGAS